MKRGIFSVLFVLFFTIGSVKCDFGQLLTAYYTGVGADTLAGGGVNALSLAFFDPTPLGQNSNCDFSTVNNAPCLKPASGSGEAKTLAWAVNIFNQTLPSLSKNTSPKRNGKPTIFFSFGGQSQGGATWDNIFSSSATATTFGQNAAKLVTSVYKLVGEKVYVGFDLDIEETATQLPAIGVFVKTFRASAPYDTYPLQLCSLSGLASTTSGDHFKVSIMQSLGPSQQGINFLNMMVSNVDASCADMAKFWRDPALEFLPPANKILGVWGELIPSWVLHNPGCTDGADPLFTWIKKNGVGIGIWQWWTGPTTDVTNLIAQIREN